MRLPALVTVFTAVAAYLVVSTLADPALAQARSCPQTGSTLVAYGHSYLRSPHIGGANTSYATLAAASLGLEPVIRALDGGTTVDVEKLVRFGPTRWQPGTSNLVLIDSSINDILNQLPPERWTAALRRTLSALAAEPAPVVLLMAPLRVGAPNHPGANPREIDKYVAQQRKVAAEFRTVRIVDATSGWQPRTDLSADGVHPNRVGEAQLAGAVERAAGQLFCAP